MKSAWKDGYNMINVNEVRKKLYALAQEYNIPPDNAYVDIDNNIFYFDIPQWINVQQAVELRAKLGLIAYNNEEQV